MIALKTARNFTMSINLFLLPFYSEKKFKMRWKPEIAGLILDDDKMWFKT